MQYDFKMIKQKTIHRPEEANTECAEQINAKLWTKMLYLFAYEVEWKAFDYHLVASKKILRTRTREAFTEYPKRLRDHKQQKTEMKSILINFLSSSMKSWWFLFNTSCISNKKFCWYFAELGEWLFPDSTTRRRLFHIYVSISRVSWSILLCGITLRHNIRIGKTSRECFGVEVTKPCNKSTCLQIYRVSCNNHLFVQIELDKCMSRWAVCLKHKLNVTEYTSDIENRKERI